MESVSISFKDGTALTAERNGACFITDERPVFPEDLSLVTVTDAGDVTVLRNARTVECASVDGRYWFTFVEATKSELLMKGILENIAAIEDALCEIDKEELA